MTLEGQRSLEQPCTQAQEVSQADVEDCPTLLEPKKSVELMLQALNTPSQNPFCLMTYMRQLACVEDVSCVDVAT